MAVLGFLGAGRMATALIGGFLGQPTSDVARIVVYDPNAAAGARLREQFPFCEIHADPKETAASADLLFLAVKPQHVAEALNAVAGVCHECCLVSLAAGYRMERLAALSGARRVARVMPNTPALIGQGASAVAFGNDVSEAERESILRLMRQVGTVVEVPENLLDAVTGLSGSGPAYVLTFIQALIDGGVLAGLPRDIAQELALQTVSGTVALARQSNEPLIALRDQVTSPGGTTMHGLHRLAIHGFEGAVWDAIQAATRRAADLSEG